MLICIIWQPICSVAHARFFSTVINRRSLLLSRFDRFCYRLLGLVHWDERVLVHVLLHFLHPRAREAIELDWSIFLSLIHSTEDGGIRWWNLKHPRHDRLRRMVFLQSVLLPYFVLSKGRLREPYISIPDLLKLRSWR